MFLKVQNALIISIHVWPVFVLLQILKKNIPCWFLSEKSLTLKCSIYSPCKQKKTGDLPMFGRPIPDTLSKQKKKNKKNPPQLKHPFPDVMKKIL